MAENSGFPPEFFSSNFTEFPKNQESSPFRQQQQQQGEFIQLSGHPDSLRVASAATVWKKILATPTSPSSSSSSNEEARVYRKISHAHPELHRLVPKFYREVTWGGAKFLELENLQIGFRHTPSMIDIKMGTRTFAEAELGNDRPRPDLYKKMCAVDATTPTENEHKMGAVTKLRYMQWRDARSSSAHLGFRIDAVKCHSSAVSVTVDELKTLRTCAQVTNLLNYFLIGAKGAVLRRLLVRLRDMRAVIELSSFFRCHEVIGSSLFICYDDDAKVGAWLIDFAKTQFVGNTGANNLTHRALWQPGNYEEGLLIGFDRLISILENFEQRPLQSKQQFGALSPTVSVKT